MREQVRERGRSKPVPPSDASSLRFLRLVGLSSLPSLLFLFFSLVFFSFFTLVFFSFFFRGELSSSLFNPSQPKSVSETGVWCVRVLECPELDVWRVAVSLSQLLSSRICLHAYVSCRVHMHVFVTSPCPPSHSLPSFHPRRSRQSHAA